MYSHNEIQINKGRLSFLSRHFYFKNESVYYPGILISSSCKVRKKADLGYFQLVAGLKGTFSAILDNNYGIGVRLNPTGKNNPQNGCRKGRNLTNNEIVFSVPRTVSCCVSVVHRTFIVVLTLWKKHEYLGLQISSINKLPGKNLQEKTGRQLFNQKMMVTPFFNPKGTN